MGFKIYPEFNYLPAYVKDNVLYCDYIFPQAGINVPVEGVDFIEQYTHVKNRSITAYLYNKGYELVLRSDGTGCFVQDGYLRRSFLYTPAADGFTVRHKGFVRAWQGVYFCN